LTGEGFGGALVWRFDPSGSGVCRFPVAAGAVASDAVDDELARRTYGGYFLIQAITGAAFWILLWLRTEERGGFEMLGAERAVTNSFLLADLVLGIVGSLVAAGGILAGRRWAPAVAMFVAGGIVYATVYILFWVGATGQAPAMLAVMVPPALLSTFVAVQVARTGR
jgi:hypothetical protein